MIDNCTQPSMMEIHSQALESIDEAYHEFLLIYRKNDLCVYGFVEGKDDPCFYRYLIEKELPEKWSIKLIISGNRNKVLHSYRSFDWSNHSKTRICFFVDRDLHEFLDTLENVVSPNIYVTDGYSIENSILGDRLLNGVLSDVYQVSLINPDDEEKIRAIVQENEEVFFEAILPLMGQIILWRRSGVKANLSNLKLGNFFSFTTARCQARESYELLREAANQIGCELDRDNDINTATTEFRNHSKSRMMVRGKYLLWFFVKQCEAIWESISDILPQFSEKPKQRINCGINNAMVYLAPRASTPESLKEFIKKNYLSFIDDVNNI